MALDSPNHEQHSLMWFDRCAEQVHAALRLMGQLVKGFVNSSNFGKLDYILPEDCAPVAKLLAWQSYFEDDDRRHRSVSRLLDVPADWEGPRLDGPTAPH